MTNGLRRPLGCRLHLHHRWVDRTTTDGSHYQQCRRCGTDRTELDDNDMNVGGKSAASGIVGLTGFTGGGWF
jgi:hypothetical protein